MIAAALFLASLFFFVFPLISSRVYPVNFRFMGIASLIPLAAALRALWKRPAEKGPAIRLVSGIMAALIIFYILIVGTMLFLAFV
jgi:hypothetical protein